MVFASCFRCGKVFGFLLIKLFKRDECFYIALGVQAVILASFTADSLNFHGDTWLWVRSITWHIRNFPGFCGTTV